MSSKIFLKNHKLKVLKGVSIAFSGRYYLKVGHGNGHLTHLHTPEQVAHWHRYGCHHQVRQFLLDSLHRMFPGKNCSPGVLLKAFNITRDCRQMCLFHWRTGFVVPQAHSHRERAKIFLDICRLSSDLFHFLLLPFLGVNMPLRVWWSESYCLHRIDCTADSVEVLIKQECIPVGCILPATVCCGPGCLPQCMLGYTPPQVWTWRSPRCGPGDPPGQTPQHPPGCGIGTPPGQTPQHSP